MEKGWLLYCIVDDFDDSLKELKGLDDVHNLCSLEHRGLCAVFSIVDLNEYGDESMKIKGEDIGWITEKACRFMEIMLLINDKHVLIPMKFLTIFSGEDRIRDIIDTNYESFFENFHRLKGCKEMSMKIYCNDKIFKETSMSEEINAFEKTLEGKPKGAAFFLRKKFDSELDNKVQDKICKTANAIIESIEPHCIDMKSNKLIPKEITGVRERMILNCAFLIDAKKRDDFLSIAEGIKEKYKNCGVIIEATGPWPPYNFC